MKHFHEIDENPETNAKLAEIINSIESNGWVGLPILSDGEKYYNGCHRATACEILDIEPEVHQMQITANWGDDEYIDYLLGKLTDSCDTHDVLQVLVDLLDEGLVDQMSVDIMRAEYEKE